MVLEAIEFKQIASEIMPYPWDTGRGVTVENKTGPSITLTRVNHLNGCQFFFNYFFELSSTPSTLVRDGRVLAENHMQLAVRDRTR